MWFLNNEVEICPQMFVYTSVIWLVSLTQATDTAQRLSDFLILSLALLVLNYLWKIVNLYVIFILS